MSEQRMFLDPLESRQEKYKYTKDPDIFTSEDVFRARFDEVEKAVANNPEKRGVASAILAACYMAFGSERVDLKRLGSDVLLPRLNGYLVAYNDQVDIAEKIKESDSDVYDMIMSHVSRFKEKLDLYFQSSGNDDEDKRRKDFKEFYDIAFREVNSIEHELFTIKTPSELDSESSVTEEESRIEKGRELVNAIEMLMNIRACVGKDIFLDEKIDTPEECTIEKLSQKYDWLINPDFGDGELTVDQAKARMLFFATMSNQLTLDIIDYKEDEWFDIWKKMTYLTKARQMPYKEAAEVVKFDAAKFAALAGTYGMSPLPILAANKAAGMFSHVKNIFRNRIASTAETRGHIRERAVAALQKRHPDTYRSTSYSKRFSTLR